MRILSIALILIGVLGLVYGGITYNRQRTVLEIGDMKATTTERRTLPISPIFGATSLVAGVALLVLKRRKAISA